MTTRLKPGDLVTEKEAAALLSISPETLRAWRTRKTDTSKGPPYLQRGRWKAVRYHRDDLAQWLNKQRTTPKETSQ